MSVGRLHRRHHVLLRLRDQAVELGMIEADGVLAEPGFFSGDVPVGHPAELFGFRPAFEQHEERVERDLFLLLAKPRLEFVGEEGGDDLEVPVASAQLEVEIHVKLARDSAGRTVLGRVLGEIVEGIEQFLVRGKFFMTLGAGKILR